MIRRRRRATDDGEIVRMIRQQLIPLSPPELRFRWTVRTLRSRLNRGTTFVWLPEKEYTKGPKGFITVKIYGNHLLVDLLAVDSEMQSRGVGSMLLKRAERYGVYHGCSMMRLYVNDDNARGIRFYEKHNMVIAWHDAKLRSYVMEKRIG